MSTTIHSDKKAGVRPAYIALGVDSTGCWHTYRTADETILVTDGVGITRREPLNGRPVDDWIAYVDDRRGWLDHPDADPKQNWLEAATK